MAKTATEGRRIAGEAEPTDSAADVPTHADALRKVAQALDALGVLVLHLAHEAERPDPQEADALLTVAEVASTLGTSRRFVRRECSTGQLEAVQLGRAYRVRASALRAYERRRMQG